MLLRLSPFPTTQTAGPLVAEEAAAIVEEEENTDTNSPGRHPWLSPNGIEIERRGSLWRSGSYEGATETAGAFALGVGAVEPHGAWGHSRGHKGSTVGYNQGEASTGRDNG